jgi:hypothetical protein
MLDQTGEQKEFYKTYKGLKYNITSGDKETIDASGFFGPKHLRKEN